MKRTAVLWAAALQLCALNAGRVDAGEEDHLSQAAFYGTVEAMPQGGLEGTWIVNGREIVVTRGTEIKQKHGTAAVGAYVKVEGNFSGRRFIVQELDVERNAGLRPADTYNCKFAGTVEKLPANGYEGLWVVAGRQIEVSSATVIDETAARASAGVKAEIKGVRTGHSVKALEIRIAGLGGF